MVAGTHSQILPRLWPLPHQGVSAHYPHVLCAVSLQCPVLQQRRMSHMMSSSVLYFAGADTSALGHISLPGNLVHKGTSDCAQESH